MADEQQVTDGEGTAETGAKNCAFTSDIWGHWTCGRPIHHAPNGVDRDPVCLMHSKDPEKFAGALLTRFWIEFEAILAAAGEGNARFDYFVFPAFSLADREIEAACIFEGATFTGNVFFSKADFLRGAEFSRAEFRGYANFSYAKFPGGAGFTQSIFRQSATFLGTEFPTNAEFSFAEFSGHTDFSKAKFIGAANFDTVKFNQYLDFEEASFEAAAGFSFATFAVNASIRNVKFKDADFSFATFTGDASFSTSVFAKDVDFTQTTFTRTAYFAHTTFRGVANFRGSKFLEDAAFRGTVFAPESATAPSAVFALAHFSKPEEVVFDDVDLSRVLFRNCDVSEVWFTSSARWGIRRGKTRGKVFDEEISLDEAHAEGLRRDRDRDYGAVAQIYQQLKKNYDARLDYWTANEFHFGEMEMQRLTTPAYGPLMGLNRRWHRNVSFVALYRWGSDYGNNYVKPMLWLFAVLLLFALVYPCAGLQRAGLSYSESYWSVWNAGRSVDQRLRWEAGLIGKSLLTAVDTAMFQKSIEYVPVYPWGRVLAIVEALLTSTLFGLFLLAIRRQFRR